MPFNGSGVFTLPAGNPVVTGTVISSSVQNNTMADVANNGLSNCITKDGQSTPTANIGFGGFRLENVANAIVAADVAPVGQIQNGAIFLLGTVAGTDTITGTVTPPITSYVAGQMFRFIATGANTTNAVTLNVGSVGAKSITKSGAAFLSPGDIPSGALIEVIYDGTQFQVIGGLLESAALPPLYRSGGATSLPSAATITVQPGAWRSISNTYDLILTTAMSKVLQASGAWSAGTGGNGNFNSGAPVNGIYNIFIIRKVSDGSLDLGFDTNVSATHIPAGYSAYRRIGSFFVTAGLTIQPYIQAGNWFSYAPGVTNYTNIGLPGGSTQGIVTVPSGVQTIAKLRTVLQGNSGINVALQPRPLSATPSAQDNDLVGVPSGSVADTIEVITDTAASIVLFSTGTFASGLYVTTAAFQDFLGD